MAPGERGALLQAPVVVLVAMGGLAAAELVLQAVVGALAAMVAREVTVLSVAVLLLRKLPQLAAAAAAGTLRLAVMAHGRAEGLGF